MTKKKIAGAAGPADWSPARVDKGSGIHLAGASELPANHRLRAEALVALGETKDPDGIIGEELIADTAARLALEAKPPPPPTPVGGGANDDERTGA